MKMGTRSLAVFMVSAVAALGASACGSSENAASTGSTAETAVAPGVAKAEAMVKGAREKPSFVAPGDSFDGPAIAKGKTIFQIPISTEIPYAQALVDSIDYFGRKVGFKVETYPTAGKPDQWARGMDLAISRHADAIVLTDATDPRTFLPQMRRAQAANIPVITQQFADPANPINGKYGAAGVGLGYRRAATLMANYAIWKTQGKGNILAVDGAPGLPLDTDMREALEATIKANCPDCKLTTISVPIPQWATDMTPKVEAALKADPNINYILPYYDSQSIYVLPALTAVGRDVPVASFNGTPEIMKLVRDGKVQMDVSLDTAWIGAGTVDTVMRVLGDIPPNHGSIDQHIPLRVFDSENIGELGTGDIAIGAGFGGVAEKGYLELWGMK